MAQDNLGDMLCEHAYRADSRLLCKSVIMYLPAEAVDETLAYVSGISPSGGAVVFDFAYRLALEGTA